MALDPSPELAPVRERLGPYLDAALERAGARALRLFADLVTVEHLLGELLDDPDAALHRLVEHAFADAPTVAADVLAISPGILVVGSSSTLPFSPRAVQAMHQARQDAAGRGAAEVLGSDVLRAAAGELEPAAVTALVGAGFSAPSAAPDRPEANGGTRTVALEGHLFRHFSQDARRALSRAGRGASRSGEAAISPAHLVTAVLATEPTLAAASGLDERRAAALLRGHTADPTSPPPRLLPVDPELLAFLAGLPAGADSLDVLGQILARPESEQAQIFLRQKVTPALIERAREALRDPARPSGSGGTGGPHPGE